MRNDTGSVMSEAVVELFITSALAASRPAELPALTAQAAVLRTMFGAVAATPAQGTGRQSDVYSIYIENEGTVRVKGHAGVAAALNCSPATVGNNLSKHGGRWQVAGRNDLDTHAPVTIIVQRGEHGDHSDSAATYLARLTLQDAKQGRPPKAKRVTRDLNQEPWYPRYRELLDTGVTQNKMLAIDLAKKEYFSEAEE